MRILAFIWHLGQGKVLTSGGVKRFVELVSRSEKYSVNFTVIENSPSLKQYLKTSNYSTIEISHYLEKYEDSLLFRFLLWTIYAIKAAFAGLIITKARSFDIVMTPSGELLSTAFPAFVTHIIRRIPLVYVVQLTPSGLPYGGFSREIKLYLENGFGLLTSFLIALYAHVTRNILVKLYNRAQFIVVVSYTLKKQLQNIGVKKTIYVVRNGIDRLEADYNGPKIYDAVFVGRHSPQKGIFHLIETWRRVVKEKPEARLILVGYCTTDMMKLIRNKLKEFDLERNIILRGVVSRKLLALIMKQSKILLFPSLEESFGLVVGEALSLGLPVICYGIPAIREIYRCESVITCPPGDIDCLAKRTLELLSDERLREELSTKARDFASRLDWDDSVNLELKLYASLLKDSI